MSEPQPTERKAAARVLGYKPCPAQPKQRSDGSRPGSGRTKFGNIP
jgi:hypothetical protein